uniref:Pentacotripeptide-repeat region of PRORP domain-containing protein n=1 Tax=Salix viminalis TaxID=40686 RepID=A0A6N2NKL7_SALVM
MVNSPTLSSKPNQAESQETKTSLLNTQRPVSLTEAKMLLQPSLHHHKASLSSTISYSHSVPWKTPKSTLHQTVNYKIFPVITCSISQIHNYGTVDYERRPMIKWNALYRRISLMENPELGSGSVLNQWENEGKRPTKWELCRVVKELRKYKRYQQALEVYDWMKNRQERFRLSPSDAAIQLDLIAKVRGVSTAEDFFTSLPSTFKDRRVYGALLNAYVRNRMREKAETLIDEMRDKGYVSHALPFNVMMTLYMNIKEYDKVDLMISEMNEKNIKLDIYSYNIWLSSCGSQGSADKMEQVYEQMKSDRSINPNWTTFSTMATMYIKMGQFEKAEDCLRKVESRITGRDRIPYHYLLSLYGNVGNKEEVYRVWNIYKSIFPSIPNLGYHAIVSSLVRLDDIEGAEKIYEEWLSIKTSYDPRIANIFIAAYVYQGNLDEAESFFDHMLKEGGKPNSNTWEILAQGHISERRTPEALSCLKEAFATPGSKSWKPNPANVTSFFKLCEEEVDMANKEALEGFLRQSGHLEDKAYASLLGMPVTGDELSTKEDRTGDQIDDEDGSEMLVSQLNGSL